MALTGFEVNGRDILEEFIEFYEYESLSGLLRFSSRLYKEGLDKLYTNLLKKSFLPHIFEFDNN